MIGSLFAAVDGLMWSLPGVARLIVWAVLAAVVSMAAYRLTSPQMALQRIRQRRAEVQQSLKGYDGAIADAYPLLGESLRLAFAQLLRVLAPTAVAALPVVALLLWLDMTYGYEFPAPGQQVAADAEPAGVPARLDPGIDDQRGWTVVIRQGDGAEQRVPLPLPVPAIHKWQWWNAVIGNPAGYLPVGSPAELVTLHLPVREYVSAGPEWARAWYAPFLAVLFAASLALKLGFRII